MKYDTHVDLKTTHKPAIFKPWSVKVTETVLFGKEMKGGVGKQEG